MIDGPKISILVVSYNTCEATLECLRSVLRETRETPFELIVVDNGSHDGSAAAIKDEFPNLRLLALDENLGFGQANNLAARHARGELLLLLNPDTVVLDGAIDALVRFTEDSPGSGIWGGRTIFADGTLNARSCARRMTMWGILSRAVGLSSLFPRSPLFNSEAYGGWERDSIREVDTVSGCFFLIRRDLWEQLEGFDPIFYMYGEEADLCVRARKLGAKPIITPAAQIIHYGGLSETVPADKVERLLRAKITLAKKHWGDFQLCLVRALWMMLVGIRAVGYNGAAWLLAESKHREKADIWRQVWRHRNDWLQGYR
jgi:GT2 family glycosyltransferase